MIANERLSIIFDGENDIDLEVLSVSLSTTINTLKIIADETLTKDDSYRFIVKSIGPGSFIINIEFIRVLSEILFTLGPNLLTTFIDIFKLRKLLKGETPKEITYIDNGVKITNNNGETVVFKDTTFNIYTNNNNIEKEMAKMSRNIARDSSRSGLVLKTIDVNKNEKTIEYSRDDLKLTSRSIDAESLSIDTKENINQVWLTIGKVDFIGDTKWEFKTIEGNKLSAEIMDLEFLKKVRSGEMVLSAETKLYVSLKIINSVNKYKDSNIKCTYTIIEVKEIRYPVHFKQHKLF